MGLSLNKRALRVVDKMLSNMDILRIKTIRSGCGATVIDCGVRTLGSIEAGVYVAKVCLCDMATINVSTNIYGKLVLPEINVSTDYPLLTTLGSQLADWEIIVNGYYAMASGPGRALALDRPLPRGVALKKGFYQAKGYRILEPKKIYREIDHFEDSDEAVLVLEAAKIPPEGALTYISSRCGVHPCNLYVLITPTTSLAGSVQIAARVVEVGIHKLIS